MNKLYEEGVTFRKTNILLLNPTGVTDKDIWVFGIVVIALGIVLVYSSKQLNQRRVER